MAQGARVPKFGDWGNQQNVPFTMYFDKARKDRSAGKIINPNDPQENPDMFPNMASPAQAPPSRTRAEPEEPRQVVPRPANERPPSRQTGENRRIVEPPARNDNMNRRAAAESANQRHGGHGPGSGRPANQSAGSDHSFDRSPLNQHYQVKTPGRGSASPAWEGKNLYDGSHGTPGRSRMRPGSQGDEIPSRVAAVPKFGDWNENDPSSADNFTHIFNKVRDQKNLGAERPTSINNVTANYNNPRKQAAHDHDHDQVKMCCFPW